MYDASYNKLIYQVFDSLSESVKLFNLLIGVHECEVCEVLFMFEGFVDV